MKEKLIKVSDMTFSLILMGSFLYANIYKERFDQSLQFNLLNVIGSMVFIVIAINDKRYGNALRQIFFGVVSGINLYYICCSG